MQSPGQTGKITFTCAFQERPGKTETIPRNMKMVLSLWVASMIRRTRVADRGRTAFFAADVRLSALLLLMRGSGAPN